jgi:hypothetical protein
MAYDDGYELGQLVGWILILATIVSTIFFNLTMQSCMKVVSRKNQKVPPWVIWLNFVPIPVFNSMVSMFYCFNASTSVNQQLGKKVANTVLPIIFPACGTFAFIILFTVASRRIGGYGEEIFAMLTFLSFITGTVVWIIYWVQMARLKKRLEAGGNLDGDVDLLDSDFHEVI